MTQPRKPSKLSKAFYIHLGGFLATSIGLTILTVVSEGDLLVVSRPRALARGDLRPRREQPLGWRRDRWQMPFDPKHLTEEQREELEWNRRAGGFGGGIG